MSDLRPPVEPDRVAPGWYGDPWRQATWRWWDGRSWTADCHESPPEKRPRLPSWLSVPVVVAGLPSLAAVLYFASQSLSALLLALVPLLLVGPVLMWLDRVEPEPWSSRLHALLWGATVAALVSGLVNTLVAWQAGEEIAAVVSAPFIEEATKAAGILWAVRRKDLDGVMDGIVYAGWVALGFAVMEDGLYFATASEAGLLRETFVLRALLTPFAHPLFTLWSGVAIGRAVSRGRSVFPSVLAGYPIAVGLHALWNGSLTYAASASEEEGAVVIGLTLLLFVLLFIVTGAVLFSFRRKEQRQFTEMIPFLVHRYGLTPAEKVVFGNWRDMLRIRSSLERSRRKHFDDVHSALARLAALHMRQVGPDPVEEQRLVDQLSTARQTSVI